jgi:hypothetical protein
MDRYTQTAWQGAVGRHSTTAQARAARTAPVSAGVTVHDAIVDFLSAAEGGSAMDRHGRAFSGRSTSELRWCLSGYVDERLGTLDVAKVQRRDLEGLVEELETAGLSPRRLRTTAKSLRALFDYARERNLVSHNPAERIALPDEDDAEQPSRGRPQADERGSLRSGADHALMGIDRAIALGLQAITVCFVLLALVLIAESL